MPLYNVYLPNKKLYDSNLDIEDVESAIKGAAISHEYNSLSESDDIDFSDFSDSCECSVEESETICGIHNVHIEIGGYRNEQYEYWGSNVSRREWQTIKENDVEIEVQIVNQMLG